MLYIGEVIHSSQDVMKDDDRPYHSSANLTFEMDIIDHTTFVKAHRKAQRHLIQKTDKFISRIKSSKLVFKCLLENKIERSN